MMPGKCEFRVRIILEAKDRKCAKTIRNSLAPDNINFPEGLKIETSIDRNRLILNFLSKGSINTLISTIDDVLMNCQVAVGALEETVG